MSVNTIAPPTNKWVAWLSEMYSSGKPPVLGTVDIQEIEDKAREVLKDNPCQSFSLKQVIAMVKQHNFLYSCVLVRVEKCGHFGYIC